MTKHRYLSALVGVAFTLLATSSVTLAADTHLQQAISETKKAIHWGDDAHHGSSFVEHTENAIDHAMMAQKAQPNPHVKKGIAYLRRGLKIAYDSHWPSRQRAGAAKAKLALKQFQAAQ